MQKKVNQLEVLVTLESEEKVSHIINVKSNSTIFQITSEKSPLKIELDPNGWLLAVIREK